MTRRVRDHRVRLAEMKRLESVFAGRGERDKVDRVVALRRKEAANYEATMKRYEEVLGKDEYKKLQKRLKADEESTEKRERDGR